jgi:hypothetical protein
MKQKMDDPDGESILGAKTILVYSPKKQVHCTFLFLMKKSNPFSGF